MTIRPATARDVPAILDIQKRSGTAALWSAEDYVAYDSTVAEVDGDVAGFVMVRQIADSEFEILNVAVAPEFRRRRIGLLLIESLLLAHKGDWFLEVRESNSAARNLYKTIGFSEVGFRRAYYPDSSEGAIVMSFRSC